MVRGDSSKVHVLEVVSTPVPSVCVARADQVGETGAGVVLPFSYVGHLEMEMGM